MYERTDIMECNKSEKYCYAGPDLKKILNKIDEHKETDKRRQDRHNATDKGSQDRHNDTEKRRQHDTE